MHKQGPLEQNDAQTASLPSYPRYSRVCGWIFSLKGNESNDACGTLSYVCLCVDVTC
jgi:hypothetical protein